MTVLKHDTVFGISRTFAQNQMKYQIKKKEIKPDLQIERQNIEGCVSLQVYWVSVLLWL